MAQVPYSPIGSERLSGSPVAGVEANAPTEAFGGSVGRAISSLGKSMEGAGNELYERAVWLQNLNNTAEAKQGDADYIIASGKLHAEYNSLEGDAAVKAYPKYVENLQTLRGDIRKRMSTPMSQRAFDDGSLGTLSRTIFNGAGHLASAQKQYVNNSIDAKISANNNSVAMTPADNFTTDAAFGDNERLIREQGKLKGLPSDQIENNISQNRSVLTATKIQNLAKTEPFKAQELLDKNRGQLWYADAEKTEQLVKQARFTVGARNIAQDETKDLYDPPKDKTPERGLEERITAARDRAAKMYPEDKDFQYQVEQNVRSMYTRRKQDIRDTEIGNITTVTAGVIGDFGGKVPSTVDELKALDPAVAKAWDDLPATKRRSMLKALANNAQGDYAPTEENYRKYNKLRGMASSDDAAQREAFMSSSIVDMDIPQKWRTSLNKLQEKMIRSAGDNPDVSTAYRQLKDAGMVPDPKDKEETAIYRGGLQGALEDFTTENKGRKPKFDELKAIGTRLMTVQPDPERWTFGGLISNKVRIDQFKVPDEWTNKFMADPRWKEQGIVPTEDMAKRFYMKQRYQEIWGKKASPNG